MVVKQAPIRCQCGQAMVFPEAEIKTRCRCGTVWEVGLDGCWKIRKVPFVSFLITSRKRDLNQYERYMRWRSRKAGSRC